MATKEEADAQAKRVSGILDRIHWPQAFMLAFFLACLVSAPIAFLTLVPEHTQEKIGNLPWSTIIGIGLPTLGAGISGFLSPFMRSMVAPAPAASERATEPDTDPKP